MRDKSGNYKNLRFGKRAVVLLTSIILALAAVIAVIFVFDTDKTVKIPVDEVGGGDVYQSTTFSNPANGTSYTTTIRNGDVINFAYKGSYYYITLPKGKYTVRVWGAQGGGCGNDNGGKGGYAAGTLTLSSATTVYIYVGGKGTNSTSSIDGNHDSTHYAGGFNGGGNGTGSRGPGGGGATDIRTGGTSLSNRVIVAAGGGGGLNTSYTQTFSSSGVLGQGASGCTSGRHSSRYSNDEGGGGGGYYGGAVRHGDDPSASYCGSNYTGGVSGGSSAYGNNAGAGRATITATDVNQNPSTKSPIASMGTYNRGSVNITVAPSSIATDPEGQAMYFTNGTSGNYDAFTNGQTNLYINSSCSTLASNYVTWTATNSQIKITEIKRYPRNGYDSCTSDGRLQLWTRVRDNYGATATRGNAVVSFYIYVNQPTAPTRVTTQLNTSDSNQFNDVWVGMSKINTNPQSATKDNIYHPTTTNRYTALIARPLRLSGSDKGVTISASALLGGIVSYDQAVISILDVSRINKNDSSRIFRVVEYDNSTSVVRAYTPSGSAIANTFSQITIEGVNSNASYQVLKCRVYAVEKNSARGSNYQINSSHYQDIDIVFKVNNTRPTLKSGTDAKITVAQNASVPKTLDSFFTDADGAITASTHKITGVKVPTNEFIQVERFGKVVSTGGNYYNVLPSGSNTPTKEEIAAATTSGELGNGYPTGFDQSFISTGVTNNAFIQYSYTGITLTIKGLRATSDKYFKRVASEKRVVVKGGGEGLSDESITNITSGDINNAENTANPGHFYILVHIQDMNDTTDTGIWLPISIEVTDAKPTSVKTERGEAVNSAMPTASGAAGQVFYFAPMGITVNRVLKPIGQYNTSTTGGSALTANNLQPLASDADNFLTVDARNPSATAPYTGKLNELLTGASTASDVSSSVSVNTNSKYFGVEEINIYVPTSQLGHRVPTTSGNYVTSDAISGYIAVRGYKITLKNWTHNRYMYATVRVKDISGQEEAVQIAIYVNNDTPREIRTDTDGTKVATLNDTSNGAVIRSTYDGTKKIITYEVPMKSKIVITPYDLLYDDNMKRAGITYPVNGFTLNGLSGNLANGVYTVGGSGSNPIVGIARDTNDSTDASGRKINYSSSEYRAQLVATLTQLNGSPITSTATDKFIASANNFGTTSAMSSRVDRLFFERNTDKNNLDGYTFDPSSTDFASPAIVNSNYVSTEFGRAVKINNADYPIDFFVIRAVRRTPDNGYAEIRLNVRDRTGSGATGNASGVTTITIRVKVLNSQPTLKNPSEIHTLSVDPVVTTDGATVVVPDSITFAATDILLDNEEDTPSFATNIMPQVEDDAGLGAFDGHNYLGDYITVSLNAQSLTITARNSTQKVKYLNVIFNVVDDQGGESTQVKLRVEVLNSKMSINRDPNTGFEQNTETSDNFNLWSVNTKNKSLSYYFASGTTAASKYPSTQVRKLVNDSDALQGAALTVAGNNSYVNAPQNATADALKDYVPYVDTTTHDNSPVGAVIRFNGATLSSYIDSYDIEYYVGGQTYRASVLRAGDVDGEKITDGNRHLFFDESGRWIVTDWAIVVKTKSYFTVNTYLELSIYLRDNAAYGGDTAGVPNGYKQGEATPVNGKLGDTFRLFVNDSTGIVPYDYYDAFGGLYTVTDGNDTAKNYISTVYPDIQNGFTQTLKKDSIYMNADRTVVTGSSGDTLLKDRQAGAYHSSVSGFDSGLQYEGASADAIASIKEKGAFVYDHTIEVTSEKDGNGYKYTYIPMSYFALSPSNVTINSSTGELEYDDGRYVSYNVSGTYSRGTISDIYDAISVTNGVDVWTGSVDTQTTKKLIDCPYVGFTAYDASGLSDLNNNAGYKAAREGKYFNNRIAMSSVNEDGKLLTGLENYDKSKYALIGNGHAMYLYEQESKLQEHLFGIGIQKKSSRAGVDNLTMTISVAQCASSGSGTIVSAGSDDASIAKNTAKVTFNLKIGNEKMDLFEGTGSNVKSDANGYYLDVALKNGSEAHNIEIVKNVSEIGDRTDNVVIYTDGDRDDKAYFYADSARKLSNWSGDKLYERVGKVESGLYVNTAGSSTSDKAQISIKNYFDGNGTNANGSYQPNSGIYGSNLGTDGSGAEGYSSFFSATVDSNGNRLTIFPLATTKLNTAKQLGSNATQQQIRDYYEDRGLVPSFDSATSTTVVSAYYPYKVLIYDSCGDGFAEGSYVALEVRVRIDPSALTLNGSMVEGSGSNRSINIQLPVGSAYTFNLKNVITNYELLSGNNGWFFEADYNTLNSKADKTIDDRFKLDTGAYLLSPFATNSVSSGNLATDNNSLRQTTGTNMFSDSASSLENQADVIMFMSFTKVGDNFNASAIPKDNNITLRVNRRTTYIDNNNRVVNKNNFIYRLTFKDSNGQTSETLNINLAVQNQNPMRRAGDEAPSEVTMRVGDSFSIITTPYDYFYNGSEAVEASHTWAKFQAGNLGSGDHLASNVSDGANGSKKLYSDLTVNNLTKGQSDWALHDCITSIPEAQQLGYVAVANDDTPWGLRISSITCDGNYFTYTYSDVIATENNSASHALRYEIFATKACKNQPVTATVIDGEGGTTTFTVYVTVTSSRPVAVGSNPNDTAHLLANGLELYKDVNDRYTGNAYDGRYKLYMTADSGEKTGDRYESSNVTIAGGSQVTAYGHITINVKADAGSGSIGGVAYDPDSSDNDHIGLYVPPSGSASSVFELNGIGMNSLGNFTYADPENRYSIRTNDTYSTFVITCNSYDSEVDEDILSFFIRDNGNDIPANATPVTISITTLYSAMKNTHQAGLTSGQGEAIAVTGADTVHVKAYDKYVGNGMSPEDPAYSESVGVPSTYQFIKYNGMPDSVDQIASDSGAHIIDPDVATSTATLSYDVKVYALMDEVAGSGDSQENDTVNFKAKQLKNLGSLFAVDRTNGYFRQKTDAQNNGVLDDYLVGGKDINGQSYEQASSNNRALIAFIQKYFTFSMGDDGVSLVLRPVTANIDVDLLMYVEVTKVANRRVRPSDATPVSAGALFYVEVEDSAPLANTEQENKREMSFGGKVGSEHTFTIFDNEHPDSSMFTDSDSADEVIVEGFNPNDTTNASYNAALRDNECTDWRAGNGKGLALTVTIDNVAHTLKVKINRRVDMVDEDGHYLPEVTLRLNITGRDRDGKTAIVTLYITIENSDFTIKNNAFGDFYGNNGVGYSLLPAEDGTVYNLNIAVSKDLAPFKFENKFTDGSLIDDPDYTTATANIDSFRLVNVTEDNENYGKYLTNEGLTVKNGDIDIATIVPTFYNNDTNRLTGFTVTAESYYRGYTGTAFIRVLDRAGIDTDATAGITFAVTLTLLNSKPFVKEGMEQAEHFIIGTDVAGATIQPIDIDIADFVDDPNPTDKPDRMDGSNATNTYLRIVSTVTQSPTEIYGTGEDETGDVFTVMINDADPRKCSIQPKVGFFGSQIVDITVSDGSYTESIDALSVTFSVKVTVVYNFEEIGSLKSVTAIRGMTKVIDIDTVVPELDNTATGGGKSAPRRLSGGVSASADEVNTFNPGAKYAVVRLSAPPAYSQYVEIGQNDDGEWQFRALRVTTNGEITLNVDIKLASELDNPDAKTYSQSFIVNIVDNPKPELSPDFESKYYQFNTTQTGDNKYILNSDGSIQLTPNDLFTDNVGDVMKFVSVESSAPSLVSVEIKSDDSLVITFHAKGTAELKITVADLTGESKAFALNVQNIDLEDPDLWMSIMISFETNMVLWICIAAGVLLAIIILIIVIIAVKRKKRKREEIEALLISEMELEEQMMRLAAPGSAPYASYGYLPPTVPVQNDPGLMLGTTAQQPNNNVLNLNPGSDNNHGVPPDSDM